MLFSLNFLNFLFLQVITFNTGKNFCLGIQKKMEPRDCYHHVLWRPTSSHHYSTLPHINTSLHRNFQTDPVFLLLKVIFSPVKTDTGITRTIPDPGSCGGDYVHARSRSMQTAVPNCSHGLRKPESTAWTLLLVFGDNRKLSTQSAEGSKAAELQGTSPCFSHENSLEEKFNV